MAPNLYRFDLPPQILTRGFWLYVWKIGLSDGSNVFYVGMTGDTGSYRAQSPFNRVSAHLGSNDKSNALRRYLRLKDIDPETCIALAFAAYGPMYEVPVPTDREAYQRMRGKVAALEKALWLFLENSGCSRLNSCPRSTSDLDKEMWPAVRSAFGRHLGLD
jgi:hypothetical protein